MIAGAMCLVHVPCFAAKSPPPTVRLPLAALGFPGHRVALMHAGASMATLHLLDKDHLLFTFGLRALVPRLVGDDEHDQDRLVGAEVVEIPSGKILERTEWHLHDHGRYLWSVGHGIFILRMGDELSTFAPLRGLASHTSFERINLPHRPGHPELIEGSPDGEIITLQLQKLDEKQEEGDETTPRHKHTTLEFYRIEAPAKATEPVQLKGAGAIGSPGLLRLALDGDGYLWADPKESDRFKWAVSFNEYEGEGQDLTAIDSSCAPRLELLGKSEFAVLTCKGSEDSQLLAAYGFDGQLNWREDLGGESLQPPRFVSAPEAGRFAMSRLLASGSGGAANSPLDDGTMSQVVRVMSTVSGAPLLSVTCMPAARVPENFDLSPDGRTLAVLSAETIDLYSLPALSDGERKDLADAHTMLPPRGSGPVVLRRITRPVVEEQAVAAEETTTPQPAVPATDPAMNSGAVASSSGSAAATVRESAQSQPAVAGDDHAAPKKPPTLLLPGETPDYTGKPKASQTPD